MTSLVRLLTNVLATWRLTEIVVEDEITRELREWADARLPGKLSYLFGCKRCVSVWAGLAVVFVLRDRWRYALATSAGTILVGDQVNAAQARAFERKAAAARGSIQH